MGGRLAERVRAIDGAREERHAARGASPGRIAGRASRGIADQRDAEAGEGHRVVGGEAQRPLEDRPRARARARPLATPFLRASRRACLARALRASASRCSTSASASSSLPSASRASMRFHRGVAERGARTIARSSSDDGNEIVGRQRCGPLERARRERSARFGLRRALECRRRRQRRRRSGRGARPGRRRGARRTPRQLRDLGQRRFGASGDPRVDLDEATQRMRVARRAFEVRQIPGARLVVGAGVERIVRARRRFAASSARAVAALAGADGISRAARMPRCRRWATIADAPHGVGRRNPRARFGKDALREQPRDAPHTEESTRSAPRVSDEAMKHAAGHGRRRDGAESAPRASRRR